MIFRNTFRLIITNFSLVWKLLCYYFICFVITLLFCGAVAYPILAELNSANVFSDLISLINNFFVSTPAQTATTFESVGQTINGIISSSNYTFNYVFIGIFVFFIFPVMFDMAVVPAGEVVYGYMATQTKYSFSGRYFKSFLKSLKFSLTRYFVTLPFNIILLFLVYAMVKVATMGNILYILLVVLLLGVLILTLALRSALFSCFAPSYDIVNKDVFSALKENFKCVKNKFGSIFSTSILLVLICFALNLIFAVFTLTVGLLVTIPFTVFMFVVFQMVSFFSAEGERYYIYTDTLIKPKTFEETQDVERLKFLI